MIKLNIFRKEKYKKNYWYCVYIQLIKYIFIHIHLRGNEYFKFPIRLRSIKIYRKILPLRYITFPV